RIAGEIYFTMALTFLELGEFEKAEFHYKAAHDYFVQADGPDSLAATGARNELGRVYILQGRFAEAIEILEPCVEVRVRTLGRHADETLTSLANLGWAFSEFNRVPEAVPLLKEVYEQRVAQLGEEAPESLRAGNNLGLILYKIGDYEAAAAVLEKLYEIKLRLYGDENLTTALALNNVALIRGTQGNNAEAAILYERVLETRRKLLGERHPSTILTLNNLANTYSFLNQADRTVELLREGIELGTGAIEETSPIFLAMKSNLADMLRRRKEFKEAYELASAAVAGIRESRGPTHPFTGLYLMRLGRIQTGLTQFEEAEASLLEAYEITVNALGQEDKKTKDARDALVELYEAWNKPEKADPWRAPQTDSADVTDATGDPSVQAPNGG
ncbi:MAG: tetratricopeptide repeat protein, partial [Phycisphaerae bacterium]